MLPKNAKPGHMHAEYPKHEITALILAGGRGTRMGGADKGLVPYQGSPLVTHLARTLAPQAEQLLVSANRSAASYQALGFDPLPDRRAGFAGPLAGLEAGLAACRTRYLLISPCDTPRIPADFGPRLWRAMQVAAAEGCYATAPDGDHYLHLLISAAAAQDLSAYLNEGGRAVRHWLAGKHMAKASFSAGELENLNTLPGDGGQAAARKR